MAAPPGGRDQALEEDILHMREQWQNRTASDILAELEKTVRTLKTTEALREKESAVHRATLKENERLKEYEKLHRKATSSERFVAELSDINTDLRRVVSKKPREMTEEAVIQRLHEDVDERDQYIQALEEEVGQLRRLQRQIINAAGDGVTGELLAARNHITFLQERNDTLVKQSQRLHDENMKLHAKKLNDNLSTSVAKLSLKPSTLAPMLCTHCKPKVTVWHTNILNAFDNLHIQLHEAKLQLDLVRKQSLAQPPPSGLVLGHTPERGAAAAVAMGSALPGGTFRVPAPGYGNASPRAPMGSNFAPTQMELHF